MLYLGTGVLTVDARTGWMCHAVGENGIAIDVKNANNHQVTRGVLLSALDVLTDYMSVKDAWGEVTFEIYDGKHQVGVATIGW